MKPIIRTFAVAVLFLLGAVEIVNAQNVSVYAGLGTAWDSSANQTINTFGNGTLYGTPTLHGTFAKLGGDVMFWPKLGFGGSITFRTSKGPYAGIKYLPIFYDFNAIYQPLGTSRSIVPELQGGFGGVYMSFCDTQQYCDSSVSNAQHFLVHLGGGVRFYIKGGFFVRPQVDVRWVNNFVQFGSDWVTEYGGSVGYTFGKHR